MHPQLLLLVGEVAHLGDPARVAAAARLSGRKTFIEPWDGY